MVPEWTLLPTLVLGLTLGAVGSLVFNRVVRPPRSMPPPGPVEPAADETVSATGGTQRFGMEDVTNELERRYKGRRARE